LCFAASYEARYAESDPQENRDAEDDVAGVKQRVLLELLKAAVSGVTMALCRVHRSAARDALRLVGEGENPPKADDGGDC
jgi:hypothetical protein